MGAGGLLSGFQECVAEFHLFPSHLLTRLLHHGAQNDARRQTACGSDSNSAEEHDYLYSLALGCPLCWRKRAFIV